jgi:hypothetical protein
MRLSRFRFLGLLSLLIVFYGCSSEPKDAKALAQRLCESFKAGDITGLKHYMSAEMLERFKSDEEKARNYFESKSYLRIRKRVDCNKPTKVSQHKDGTQSFYFGSYFKADLREIKGKWYYIKR